MSAAYDNDTQSLNINAGSASFAHVSTGSNLAFLVWVALTGVAQTVSSCSLGGVSASLLGAVNISPSSGTDGRLELWGGVAQPSGSQTCSVTLSASNSSWDVSVESFSSAAQSATFSGVEKATEIAGNAFVRATVATATGDLVVDGTCSTCNNGTTSSGTQRWLDNTGNSNTMGATTGGGAAPVVVTENYDNSPTGGGIGGGYAIIAANVRQFVAQAPQEFLGLIWPPHKEAY